MSLHKEWVPLNADRDPLKIYWDPLKASWVPLKADWVPLKANWVFIKAYQVPLDLLKGFLCNPPLLKGRLDHQENDWAAKRPT